MLDIDNTETRKDEDGNVIKDENGKAVAFYKHELTLEEAIAHPFLQRFASFIYTSPSVA